MRTALSKIFIYSLFALAITTIILVVAGCLSSQPSCYDNSRNMDCMTAPELRKELAK